MILGLTYLQLALWALLLIAQNFAFTFVSRARNSGSLKRHIYAAIGSNGVWFIQSLFLWKGFQLILAGSLGLPAAIAIGLYYTTFTITGSVAAHYWALKTEKGKSAVGASKKYAQITTEEWERVKRAVKGVSDFHIGDITNIPPARPGQGAKI